METLSPPMTDEDAVIADGDTTDRDPLAEAREATPASAVTTELAPREVTSADETFLVTTANEIRTHLKLARCELIEVGRLLAEAKECVGHGQWLSWLEREFAWSQSTALNLMQLHEAFGANPQRVTDLNLDVSSLYLIAAPKTPPEARDEVIRRAEAGEAVPRTEVKRIVQEEKAKLKPREQRRAPNARPVRRKLAEPQREPEPEPEPVDEENLWIGWGQGAQIGAALNEFGELVTGGDAGNLLETLGSAIRTTDEGPRGKVLAALKLLGRLDQELRDNPP